MYQNLIFICSVCGKESEWLSRYFENEPLEPPIIASLHVGESKTVLDSGFYAVDSGFQELDCSHCQWNLDSVFQSLVGFRIP